MSPDSHTKPSDAACKKIEKFSFEKSVWSLVCLITLIYSGSKHDLN